MLGLTQVSKSSWNYTLNYYDWLDIDLNFYLRRFILIPIRVLIVVVVVFLTCEFYILKTHIK